MLRVLVVCLAGLSAVSALAQQGDLSISGAVINSKTGEPIKHAMVLLNGFPTLSLQQPGRGQTADPEQIKPITRSAFTDATGEFHFTGLQAGTYNVTAQKPEFNPDANQQNAFRPLELSASATGIRIDLAPLGVLTGKIVDQDGLPTPGINVQCLTSLVVDGQKQVRSDRNVITDDRGVYRFWNLTPGKYYIKAAGTGGGTAQTIGNANGFIGDEAFFPVYFGGGSTLASAAPIEMGPGAEVSADFAVKFEPAFRVAGTIANFVPHHAVNFQLRTGDEDISAVRASVNSETGRFQLGTPIVPGAYVLLATQDQTIAETPFVVRAADIAEVALTLNPLIDIPVVTRFTGTPPEVPPPAGFEGQPPQNCFATLRRAATVTTISSLPILASGIGRSRRDSIQGLAPGSYRFSATCLGGYPRSAVSGTHDLAADPTLVLEPGASPPPIEITAAYGGGSIQGKIASDRELPLNLNVVLVPRFASIAGPQMTIAAHGPNDKAYSFFFANLAPGSYSLYAFARNDIEFRNPDVLQTLPGGVAVEIEGDAAKEVTLDGVIP